MLLPRPPHVTLIQSIHGLWRYHRSQALVRSHLWQFLSAHIALLKRDP